MTKDEGPGRAHSIDLNIDGQRLSVLCEDPAGASLLRSTLDQYVSDEPAPLAFSLQVPVDNKNLYVLMDRSGFVLARVREPRDAVAILGSHLAALLPPPSGTVRIRARALLGNDGSAVLAGFPLFVDPPIVERRLARAGYQMISRLAVDVNSNGALEMTPNPWSELSTVEGVAGHAGAPTEPVAISQVLVPGTGGHLPSQASLVAFLASSAAASGPHSDRLAIADRLSGLPFQAIAGDSRSARYEALEQLGKDRETPFVTK